MHGLDPPGIHRARRTLAWPIGRRVVSSGAAAPRWRLGWPTGVGAVAALAAIVVFASAAGAAPPPYTNAVLADSPTAYWRLGEAPGATTAVDASGHSNAGTYHTVTLGNDGGLETDGDTSATFSSGSWVDLGAAGNFDGGDGYGPMTVELWISTLADGETIIYRPDQVLSQTWSVYVDSSGRIGAVMPNSTGNPMYFGGSGPPIPVDDGAWHHVVVANDGGTGGYIRIWVDGTEQDTEKVVQTCPKGGSCPLSDVPSGTNPLTLGTGPYGPFTGDIDEVAVYNHVLTNAQVNAHYTSGETYSDASDQPTLTEAQRTQALNIVTSDPRFSAVIGSTSYSVTSTSAWTKLSGGLLGAEVDVDWATPQSINYAWPDIRYDDSEASTPPYTELTDSETYSDVTGLRILVDLNRGVMVSMQPDGTAEDPPAVDQSSQYEVNAPSGDVGGYDSSLRRIYIDGDWFWNFDFSSDQIRPGSVESRSKVDMPVNLIWWNLADVTKAKDALVDYGFHEGCAAGSLNCLRDQLRWAAELQHMKLKDGRPSQDPTSRGSVTHLAQWDQDRGAVQGWPVKGIRHHYRIYAPSPDVGGDDRMYNLDWSFYVVATSHIDRDDHCHEAHLPNCHQWSGMNEDAERYIRKKAIAAGYVVDANAVNMRNGHDPRPRGRKRFQNNGLATKIRLP
jgi:Concanavalin A-like lectin/glucanases superfamily